MKSPITTHVLDTSLGRPAAGVPATLEIREKDGSWKKLGGGSTNADGRMADLLPSDHKLAAGTYRMTFDTAAYFAATRQKGFYPCVSIVFEIAETASHYHIPLLLSPFGYSTYRGS